MGTDTKIKQRADRNRTLTLSPEETRRYAAKCLKLTCKNAVSHIINKTINQDLFDALRYLPDAFADLIVIDPPYNLSVNFHDEINFKQTSDEQYATYVRSWLSDVLKKLKPDGSLYVCCDWRSSAVFYTVLNELVTIKNRITWQREKGRGAGKNWKNAMEDIWFCTADKKNYYFDLEAVKQKRKVIAPYKENGRPKGWEKTTEGNFRLTCPSNFWDDITIPYWSMPENTDHPTQKPEKLIAKLILASCPKDGIVFDPFLGSGTTSVAAKKLGRSFCGIEVNSMYAAWAEKRLELAEADKAIQGYAGGVFWERNTLSRQKTASSR